MYVKLRPTYDPRLDSFRMEILLLPCLVFGYLFADIHYWYDSVMSIKEYFWTFSILLESVAILPQLFLLQKSGEAETITTHYLFALGAYRGLYLLNWIYRYFQSHSTEPIAVVAGILQTALYSDFFYIYYKRVLQGKSFKLPL